jgi:hypothetical protein
MSDQYHKILADKDNLHIGAHEGTNPDLIQSDETKILNGLSAWIDLGLKVGKSIDNQTAAINKLNDNAKLQKNVPIGYSYSASGVYPSSGNLILTLGTPDLGTTWEVAQMAIGGTDVNIAIAGSAGAYVVGNTNVTGGLTNLQDYANGLPNVGFYSQKQFIVNDREYLLVAIFSGTPGVTYVASAQVTVFDNSASGGNVVVAS